MSALTATRLGVRFYLTEDAEVDLADCVPVFHRWIQEEALSDILIDVSDYTHVPDGPGVLLVAHEASYGFDDADGRLGLQYRVRRPEWLQGQSPAGKWRRVLGAAATAAALLEGETAMMRGARFRTDEFDVSIADRLVAPNTDATLEQLEGSMKALFSRAFGVNKVELRRQGEKRTMFSVRVRTGSQMPVGDVVSNLEALAA